MSVLNKTRNTTLARRLLTLNANTHSTLRSLNRAGIPKNCALVQRRSYGRPQKRGRHRLSQPARARRHDLSEFSAGMHRGIAAQRRERSRASA